MSFASMSWTLIMDSVMIMVCCFMIFYNVSDPQLGGEGTVRV